MNGKAIFPGGNSQSLDNIAGQPIAEYTHSKSGTVHKLEGPVNAKNIVFEATGDYNDGDTWTLNDNPITVTYNGGEELLPTAVLVGDMVQAVVMENQLRLMLQKPTPQESALINWNYADPVNQRGKGDYTAGDPVIYTLDMVRLRSAVLTLGQEYTNVNFTGNGAYVPRMAARVVCDLKAGQKYTIAGLLRVGSNANGIRFGATAQTSIITGSVISLSPAEQFKLVTKTFTAPNNIENPEVEILGNDKTSSGSADVIGLKLEPGKRFTGWPVWDYGTELRKCQRYLLGIRPDNYKERIIPIGQGVATTNGKVRVLIPTPVSMRTRPVFNVDINNLRVVSTTPAVENGIIPDTVNNMFYSNNLIFIDVYAEGLTAGNAYELYLFGTTTETMLFSAEL